MNNRLVLFRTDALPEIGLGHLSRCLTLAGALRDQGAETVFVMRSPSQLVEKKVSDAQAGLSTLPLNINLADDLDRLTAIKEQLGASAIVLDGYQFTQSYIHELGQIACCLFFDELAEFEFSNALVLNQNVHASAMSYKAASSTRLLLGPRFAVLRPEFASVRTPQRNHRPIAERLLISFGGSDPHGLSAWSLKSLAECKSRFWIRVILGAESRQADVVDKLAKASPHKVDVLHNVSDMASLMNWADIALSASGTNTTLEMSCLGLPMVLIIQAENQRLIGEEMGRNNLAVQLGFWNKVDATTVRAAIDRLAMDKARRQEMSSMLMDMVDGLGAKRVAEALLETCPGGRS